MLCPWVLTRQQPTTAKRSARAAFPSPCLSLHVMCSPYSCRPRRVLAVLQLPLSTDNVLQLLALADQLMIEPALTTCVRFLETEIKKSSINSAKL
jgi:hypothetical protein